MSERIMVGMSGGVDSSVAAALLCDAGNEVTGATMQLYGSLSADAADAAAVCARLSIGHHVLDLRREFADIVLDNFISEYAAGRTPNPCVVCNKNIKFGAMLEAANRLGCEKIATGHYAGIVRDSGRYLLIRPSDRSKDQTYVLYTLSQEQLSRTVFPLGGLTKGEVREKAAEKGFLNAGKADSQDICFVPDGDYASFIERYTGKASERGEFTDTGGKILGCHNGLIRYTVGQRKGLGIALGKPAFVLSKDTVQNRVVLGDEEGLFFTRVAVNRLNFIPFDRLCGDMRVTAKLRYRHTEQPAVLHPTGEDGLIIEFDTPQRAPSPGQSAVFYDGDTVVGGGIIRKGLEENG